MKKSKLFYFTRYYGLYFCMIFNAKNILVRVLVVKPCRKIQPETLLPKDMKAKKLRVRSIFFHNSIHLLLT